AIPPRAGPSRPHCRPGTWSRSPSTSIRTRSSGSTPGPASTSAAADEVTTAGHPADDSLPGGEQSPARTSGRGGRRRTGVPFGGPTRTFFSSALQGAFDAAGMDRHVEALSNPLRERGGAERRVAKLVLEQEIDDEVGEFVGMTGSGSLRDQAR